MTECANCGAQVSARFARVYGDNQDRVYACLECHSGNDLVSGAGAFEDYEGEDPYRADHNDRSELGREARVQGRR